MEDDIKSCVNITKCVGTISELNLEFHQKNESIIVKGAVVLSINGDYIRFNIFASSKMADQYYRIIETFSIPYSFISSIDKNKYTLNTQPITVGLMGSVKIMKDNAEISKINFNVSDNPTNLFIISNFNKYGHQATYIARSKQENKQEISTKIQGVINEVNKEYVEIGIINKDLDIEIDQLKYDDKLNLVKDNTLCDLDLIWDKGFEINNDIVYDNNKSGYKLIGFKKLDYEYDSNLIKRLVKIYKITNNC